jgi:hypothetical protein
LFAFALFDVLNGNPEIALQKLRILARFLSPARRANVQLTPYVLIIGKSVEARERLAVESKSGNVENEPRIVSTPRDGNHLRSLRLGLGLFSLRFSAFIFLSPFVIGVSAKQVDKQC